MSKTFPLVALAFLAFSNGVAASEDCKQIGTMTGWVSTVNVSETLQYGLTEITVEREGKPYFSATGVIVGQLNPIANTLDHTIYFSDGTKLETSDDLIIQLAPVSACEFEVKELITSVWADKKLKRLSNSGHQVFAVGTVSYCPENNRNDFEIEGTVCFN